MKILDFINSLPVSILILCIAMLVLIDLLVPYIITLRVKKIYENTGSPDKAIDKLRIYNTYIFGGISVVSFLCIIFLLHIIMGSLGLDKFYITLGIFFLLTIVVSILAEFIQHNTVKTIRGTTERTNNKLFDTIKAVLITLLPMFIFLIIINFAIDFLSENEQIPEIVEGAIIIALPIMLIVLINLLMPLLYPMLLKASILEEGELRSELETFVKNNNLENVVLYKWPTRDKKLVNALVCGLLKKRIFISDYLMDNMTIDEILSILAHEIGHIKKKHTLKRMFMIIIGILLLMALIFALASLDISLELDIPGPVIFIVIISFVVMYFIFFAKYLYRKHETQADIFVIESGNSPEVFATALMKLAELNHVGKRFNRADAKFQTHPSMVKRIKTIEEKYSVDLSHIIS